MSSSYFVVSLDFELHWGRFDKTSPMGSEAYYQMTREAVPQLLRIFEKYDIAVTWATVGMLLARDREDWHRYAPLLQANYHQPKYSAYRWFENQEVSGDLVFAPDLVAEVLNFPKQELGCHTYSHFYTQEKGQCTDSFREDLKTAKNIVKEKLGVDMSSLVFPRNQYDENAIAIAAKEGFTAVRTNPEDWYWKKPQEADLLKRVFRSADSLIPLGKRSSFPLASIAPKTENQPCRIPASRFFRPYQHYSPKMNQLKLNRIKEEMSKAAVKSEVYHLWWHPHNHGYYLEESLGELEQILTHFQFLHRERGMESRSMRGLVEEFSERQ
ncbi:polysaccharide deacetylase family protein [Pleomorphovibrio marinus]|uniref:polysaccharide deacetylase family protein n=1 Tax=Pleomorphovibrio marinus TaxID=2164132 RepID=UPI000E0C800F|nr:polysaccharide deacetylase family protein [Pleomorphovibrio marinus]